MKNFIYNILIGKWKKEYWKELGFNTEIGCLRFYARDNKTFSERVIF